VELHERTGASLFGQVSLGKSLAMLGYRRLSVRPQHPKSDPVAPDPDARALFKNEFGKRVTARIPAAARGKPVEIWFQK